MTQAHVIELAIVGIILIDLYIISKRVDDGLRFLKRDMDYIEKDMKVMHDMLFPQYTVSSGWDLKADPSFKEKVKKEEQRIDGYPTTKQINHAVKVIKKINKRK